MTFRTAVLNHRENGDYWWKYMRNTDASSVDWGTEKVALLEPLSYTSSEKAKLVIHLLLIWEMICLDSSNYETQMSNFFGCNKRGAFRQSLFCSTCECLATVKPSYWKMASINLNKPGENKARGGVEWTRQLAPFYEHHLVHVRTCTFTSGDWTVHCWICLFLKPVKREPISHTLPLAKLPIGGVPSCFYRVCHHKKFC